MTLSRRDFLATLPAAATFGAPALDYSLNAYAGASQEEQAGAPREKGLLATRCPPDLVQRHLLPMREWKPFPAAADRGAWQALPSSIRAPLIADAEPHLGKDWPQLTATLFLDFVRTGNRVRYETVMRARRARLRREVMAE